MTLTGKQTLQDDQRGAVIIIGIFVAAFLIGGLYYLIGVNDAIRYREHMQDSADSAAWSAAVMHARGMNLVALLNMAKLSAVALTTALLAVMIAVLQTISWIRGSWIRRILYGWTIPFLAIVFIDALEAYERTQPKVDDVVEAANRAQDALMRDLPEIAELRAQDIAESGFGAPVAAAFTERPYKQLPIEEGSTFDFCAQFSNYSDPPGQAAWVPGDTYSVHFPAYSIVHKAFRSVPSGTVRSRARRYGKGNLDAMCMSHGVTARQVTAELGEEPYQLRYYTVGDEFPTATTEAGVKIATWGADEDGGQVKRLRDIAGQVAVAQSEFYFDGDERKVQYLWEMAWRPRLRRVRRDEAGSFVAGCQESGAAGGSCVELDQVIQQLEQAMVH